jgi:hypothetical protein
MNSTPTATSERSGQVAAAPTGAKPSLLTKMKKKLRGLFRRKKKDLEIYPLF